MNKISNSKQYDLEERTLSFARNTNAFVKQLPKTICNIEYVKQLIRSSGSVGANYIEANESLGKKDFAMKIRICRKEAKESRYWLNLIEFPGSFESMKMKLMQEATELIMIFSAILKKSM
jgi:four helix bundle protein